MFHKNMQVLFKEKIRRAFPIFLVFLSISELPAGTGPYVGKLINKAISYYAAVQDYTCRFHKKELVKGRVLENRNILLKFKKPHNVYMKWTEGEKTGAELIYAGEKYGNNLVLHMGGKKNLVNLKIDPAGTLALKENRHSVCEAGIGYILGLIEENYRRWEKTGAGNIVFVKEEIVFGRKSFRVNAVFPEGRGYYSRRIEINFDAENFLPIKITVFGFKNEFLEEYGYSELKINPGLTGRDFDTGNKEYDF